MFGPSWWRWILLKEKNSLIFVVRQNHLLNPTMGMKNGIMRIEKLKGGRWYLWLLKLWSVIYAYPLFIKFGVPWQKHSVMEVMNYKFLLWTKGPSVPNKVKNCYLFIMENWQKFSKSWTIVIKVVMKDADDIVTYKKSIEQQRVHIFLVGLDKVFDQICGYNLCK